MWKALGLRVKPFGLESVDDWIWESETLESLYMAVEVRLFGSIHREYHWLIFENCLLKGGILDLLKSNRCKVMSLNLGNQLKWVFDFARVVSGIVVFSFMCFWNVWFDWVWDFRKVACCSASVNTRYSWSHSVGGITWFASIFEFDIINCAVKLDWNGPWMRGASLFSVVMLL